MYFRAMQYESSNLISLGNDGGFVVPLEVRERYGWRAGDVLIGIDSDAGLLVTDEPRALSWLQSRVQGRDLVAELLADRRDEVRREGAAGRA